jgi:nitrous oxide reductase accessory protein NosL
MKKKLLILVSIFTWGISQAQNYCVTSLGGFCGSAEISNFSITGTSLNNSSTCSTSPSGDAYTYYAPSATTFTTLVKGQTYTATVTTTSGTPFESKLFIDYNGDGDWFDNGEEILVCTNCGTAPYSVSFTIPTSSVTDTTRLRIRTRQANIADACENMGSGETEDYLVYLDPGAPCAGTPSAGAAAAADTTICPSEGINLFLIGATFGSGTTYQWESSTTAGGPFTPILGATSAGYSSSSINTNAYYQCVVTCTNSGLSATSSSVFVSVNPFTQCYCNTNLSGACSPTAENISFNTLSNPSTFCNLNNNQAYTLWPDTGNLTTTLLKGNVYPLSLTTNGIAYQITAFIDYNRDGAWDNNTASERIDILPTNFSNTQTSFTVPVLIPLNADTGSTGMRIRIRASSFNDACDPLGSGETEDYTIRIINGIPCAGTPVVGTTNANDTTVCIGQVVNFGLNGFVPAADLSFQWQKNSVNLLGDTLPFLQDTIAGPDTYRCIVTCNNSGLSATSAPLTVIINPFLQCYCASDNASTFGTDIGNVTVGSFTNGTFSPTVGNFNANASYTNYSNLGPIPMLSGIPNSISVSAFTSSTFTSFTSLYANVYIDYNHNGDFSDTNELVLTGTGTYNTASSSIISGSPLVPSNALTGQTGMRVMIYESNISDPCNPPSFTSGETEDYIVNIQTAQPCSGAPTGGTSAASDTLICPLSPVTMSAQGATLGLGITYQWQSSSNPNGPFSNIANANGLAYFTDSLNTPTYFQCLVTCTNSSQIATSSTVFVDVKPFTQCYCNTNLSGSCSPNAENITFNTINNPSTFCNFNNNQAYTVWPDSANTTTTLLKGNVYPLSLTTNGIAYQITAFIDYNKDGVWDNDTLTERIDILPTNFSNTQTSFTKLVLIPLTADTGALGMRIRIRASNFNDACDPLGSGETEDYTIRIIDGSPCAGTPIVGSTQANDTNVCIGQVVSFGLNGFVPAANLSFQWQLNGVNLPGDTLPVLQNTAAGASTYQCIVTCNNSGLSATSTPLTLTINPFNLCYCSINSTSTFGTDVGNVTINGFTNGVASPVTSNPNASATYTNYSSLGPIPLLSGAPNSLQLSAITSSSFTSFTTLYGNVYIDYNQDGDFSDPTELVYTGQGDYTTTTSHIFNGAIVVPPAAITGQTGLRVMIYESSIFDPCIAPSFTGGETEDYVVDIQTANPCSGAPIAGNAVTSDSLVCATTPFNLSLSGASTNFSGLSYQWFANGVAIPNDTLPIVSGISQAANTTYTCVITCANSSQSSTSVGVLVSMDSAVNCACFATFGSGCSGDQLEEVSINGVVNNSGVFCPSAPYYTFFSSPMMTASPNDTIVCNFKHGTAYLHYVNVWIDYNNDFQFTDPERVLTNVTMPQGTASVGTYFIAGPDSGVFRMRVVQNYNTQTANPQSCGTYSYGETEDYTITISDTVQVITGLGKPVSKSDNFNVKLFPNPTSGVINYQMPLNVKQAEIKVCDLLGRVLISTKANSSQQLDISSLKNGSYQIIMNLDGKIKQSKIVLNK